MSETAQIFIKVDPDTNKTTHFSLLDALPHLLDELRAVHARVAADIEIDGQPYKIGDRRVPHVRITLAVPHAWWVLGSYRETFSTGVGSKLAKECVYGRIAFTDDARVKRLTKQRIYGVICRDGKQSWAELTDFSKPYRFADEQIEKLIHDGIIARGENSYVRTVHEPLPKAAKVELTGESAAEKSLDALDAEMQGITNQVHELLGDIADDERRLPYTPLTLSIPRGFVFLAAYQHCFQRGLGSFDYRCGEFDNPNKSRRRYMWFYARRYLKNVIWNKMQMELHYLCHRMLPDLYNEAQWDVIEARSIVHEKKILAHDEISDAGSDRIFKNELPKYNAPDLDIDIPF